MRYAENLDSSSQAILATISASSASYADLKKRFTEYADGLKDLGGIPAKGMKWKDPTSKRQFDLIGEINGDVCTLRRILPRP